MIVTWKVKKKKILTADTRLSFPSTAEKGKYNFFQLDSYFVTFSPKFTAQEDVC